MILYRKRREYQEQKKKMEQFTAEDIDTHRGTSRWTEDMCVGPLHEGFSNGVVY